MTIGELRTIKLFQFIKDNQYIHAFTKDLKQLKDESNACAYIVIPIYKEQENKVKTEKVKVPTKKIVKTKCINKQLDEVFNKVHFVETSMLDH